MERPTLYLVLISIVSCIAFFAINPVAKLALGDFYPMPWTLILIGLIMIGVSYCKPNNRDYQFAIAGGACCLGWLAWRLAVVIDHTCISGWCGFLSLAFLMSIRFLSTAKPRWCPTDWRLLSVVKDLVLILGIFLFATSLIVYPFTPHH